MNAKPIVGTTCEHCGEFTTIEGGKPETKYQCTECEGVWGTKDEAEECCEEET